MKRFRKHTVYLVLALSVAALASGCKKKAKETEPVSEKLTEAVTEKDGEVEVKTGTATNQTKLYTSRDKTFSINLPDNTWKNTKDTEDMLVFEASEGSITITHLSGSTVSSVKLPESKEEVLENFRTAGKNVDDYEVTEFKKTNVGTTDQYHTVIKCSDAQENYVYSVGYDLANAEEIYSVTGLVKSADEDVLKEIQTAVESFKLLAKTTGGKKDNPSGKADVNQNGQGQTGDTKVLYDSNGNPVTVTKNADGSWTDGSGKTYDMQEYGVMGSDGYWYTYDAPYGGGNGTGSNENNNNNNENNNNNNNNNTGTETNGFYDRDGNYISVTKDANGNWVDSYGTVYYFGDDGVTDNAGNYYPYKDSSETTGFYDDQGNYITVTKNSNGEWVDSSGAKYVFGDDGVTDSAGNFYPY